MNPEESFVLKSVTRREIADDFNARATEFGLVEGFQVSPEDGRLTSRVCGKYADIISRFDELDRGDREAAYGGYISDLRELCAVTFPDWAKPAMRTASELTHGQLEAIVDRLHGFFYATPEGVLDPDKEVSGADLVDELGRLFKTFGMVPPELADDGSGLDDSVFLYGSRAECVDSRMHLTSRYDNGYCSHCGEQ